MKRVLSIIAAFAVLFASLQALAAEDEISVYAGDTGEAEILTDADKFSLENADGVTALVACFYDFAEHTISLLSDVINKEVLMDKIYRIDFKSAAAAQDAYVILKSHPNVKTVDYDREIKFDTDDPDISEDFSSVAPMENTDGDYPYNDYDLYGGKNWYLDDINAPKAWEAMKEYDNVYQNSACVAVIDSGIDTNNPDLKNRILTDGDGNMIGYNLLSNYSASFEDDYSLKNTYHGTRVSSVIAAEANNGVGICGVAGEFNVKILPIKVFNSTGDGATASVLIKAVSKAVENNVDVINMSIGSVLPIDTANKVETMQEAINAAVNAGCVVVAAAGNHYSNQLMYPASYDNVISVAAYDTNRNRSVFSQYNEYIDVSAPGESMALLLHSDGGNITDSTVNKKSAGTSFSAPVVSAAAALLRIANPDITPTEIANIIKNRADDLGREGYDTFYGFGAVNLEKTVKSAYDGFVEIKSLEYTKNLNVAVGESRQIETQILPANAQNPVLKYKSSDTSVATVSNNGVVLGVSPGEADIYITTDFDTEFSKDEKGNSFYCHVFVKPDIVSDGKVSVRTGEITSPTDVSNGEFIFYADGKIWRAVKDGTDVSLSAAASARKPYEFCEYLPDSPVFKYALVRKIDKRIIFAKDAAFTSMRYYQDTDSNPTYVAAAHNKNEFVVVSSTGNIMHFTPPKTDSGSLTPVANTIYLDENKTNKLYVNDIAYISHEKCGFYVMTGKSDAGVQYMYIADFKNGSIDVRHVNVSLENGEMYEKLLVEGQFVYVLTNKAVYTIKTGRNGTNLATSGSLAKYADIDRKLIKDINMITVGGARVLAGFGANNNLYVIGRGAENFSVKSYGGTLTNLIEFNGGLFSVADGNLNSEKVSYVPAENKSLISQLCTYKVNILDKKKRLVENYPSDGKFTVEYYAETIDRIIFENEGYGENSAAQNRLPVSVVFAVYNADTGLLADVRVNNFMLDYAYVSESPEDSIGSLLKCEETFNLGKGNYYAKIMTFKGNNFYWPKKNESTDTLDVFAKTLGE